MKVLIDTNVLLRIFQPSNPHSKDGSAAISVLLSQGCALCIAPQNLYELWAVATRPLENNGFGMEVRDTIRLLDKCVQQFALLDDEHGLFAVWLKLMTECDVRGKRTHDARLVAAMIQHSISKILTFNSEDFKNMPVAVLNPVALAQGTPP